MTSPHLLLNELGLFAVRKLERDHRSQRSPIQYLWRSRSFSRQLVRALLTDDPGHISNQFCSVAYWTKAGFPACKLLVGVPSYAYSFTTTSSTLAITKRNGKQSLMYQPKLATLPKGDSNDVKAPAGVKDVCGVEQPAGYAGGWTYNSVR